MHSPLWSVREHLLLFTAYLEEIDWERRAIRMTKEFGSGRSKNFFNSRSCKAEFDRLMLEPVPGEMPASHGIPYSHKAVIDTWIQYFKSEISKEDGLRMETQLVTIRNKIDILEKVMNKQYTSDELLDLVERLRMEDEKRDPEQVERTVSAYMTRLEEIDRLGLRKTMPIDKVGNCIPPTRQSVQSPHGIDSAFRSMSPRARSPIKSPIRPLVDAIREANTPQEGGSPVKVSNAGVIRSSGGDEMIGEEKMETEFKPHDVSVRVPPITPRPTEGEPKKRGKGRPPKSAQQTPVLLPPPAPPVVESPEVRSRRHSIRLEDGTKKEDLQASTRRHLPRRSVVLPSDHAGTPPSGASGTLVQQVVSPAVNPIATPTPNTRESRRVKAASEATNASDVDVKEEVASVKSFGSAADLTTGATFLTPAADTTNVPSLSPKIVKVPSRAGSVVIPVKAPLASSVRGAVTEMKPSAAVSIEVQTEVSIRWSASVAAASTGGGQTRKIAQARRTRGQHASAGSASRDSSVAESGSNYRDCAAQTSRVELAPGDEVFVHREPPQSCLPRGLVDVQPVSSLDGYGSDDDEKLLSTLKRRTKTESGSEKEKEREEKQRKTYTVTFQCCDKEYPVKPPTRLDAFMSEDNPGTPATSKRSKKDDSVLSAELQQKLSKFSKEDLQHVKSTLCSYWQQIGGHKHAGIFRNAVSDKEAPMYKFIVKRPMDLWSIKCDVEKFKVITVEELKHRLLLMFCNAVMFNSTGHDVNICAKEMAQETVELIRRLNDSGARTLHPVYKRNAKVNAEETLQNLTQVHHHQARRNKLEVEGHRVYEAPKLGLERRVRKRLQSDDEFPKLFRDM